MKLSEFKNKVIELKGEEEWKKIINKREYKIYVSPEEEQLEAVYNNPYDIQFSNNPSEKAQLYAIVQSIPIIDYIKQPTDNVIEEVIKKIEHTSDYLYILKHLENDLNEIKEKIEISKLIEMTLTDIENLRYVYFKERGDDTSDYMLCEEDGCI